MENQQLQKHDIHGNYVCQKCGWPYPKPQPSSKHRRAHKKICGTIEGYNKVVDMEGSVHSTISDDVEDHNKTPTPFEKGNGRTRSLNNKTEDDVYSDAATEFSEGGLYYAAVTQDQGGAAKSDTNVEKMIQSSDDTLVVAESVKPLDGIASSVMDSSTDSQNEDSVLSVNRNVSVDDLHTVKSETQKDVAVEIEKVDGSLSLSEKGTDVEVEKDNYLDSSAVQFTISPTNVDAETTGVMSKSGETVMSLEPVPIIPDEGLVRVEGKLTDVSTEVEHVNASDDTTKTTVDSAEGVDYTYFGDLIEKGEVDDNLLVLSVPDDIHVVDNSELLLEDFKDHKALKTGLDLENSQSEDSVAFVSDRHVLEDSVELDHSRSVPMVKDVAAEEEVNLSEVTGKVTESQRLDEKGTPSDFVMPPMDKTFSVSSVEDSVIASGNEGIVQASHLPGVNGHEKDSTHGEGGREDDDDTTSHVTAADAGYEKIEFGKDDLAGDAGDPVTTPHVIDETVVASSNGVAKESFSGHTVVNPESAEKVPELQINSENNLQKRDYEKLETEDYVGGVDNSEAPTKESCSVHAVAFPETANKSFDGSDNNGFENDGIQKSVEDGVKSKEEPVEEHLSVQPKAMVVGSVDESSVVVPAADSSSARTADSVDVIVASDTLQETTEDKLDGNENVKEPTTTHSALDVKSSINNSTEIDDSSTRAFDATSGHGSESFQEGIDKQLLAGSVTDLSADSISQTDSLEGNWGSVSVLSIQSDAQAVIDTETLPSTESQAIIGEKTDSKPVSSEGQHQDKSEMFEPPSFMTLVEPVSVGNGQKAATAAEIQTGQNSQQAGWFPSITQVVNESPGRKKNEEIIAKVTNWSTGKQQHTPLKNLLGEASIETRAKSPNRKENVATTTTTTVNSILAPESPLGHAGADREIGKEWNSPARYPTEIKREKRKSRPYWAQFVCCSSSVH
ncbi:uncharacterized protein LOC115722359 isoform X1 [Cannabis sativa]|uniref:C2H2-type domain-containing protein n=1 Tax=Cannabis sativa TaxID=3483 RepID=A0A7J6EFA8_CANSA|nr:uncharacterized protein LOC115722359 isoform X1 [Cannabis sativa]KAF4357082.1 hypothetical protein G4B88_004492 [Cannabis sativa]